MKLKSVSGVIEKWQPQGQRASAAERKLGCEPSKLQTQASRRRDALEGSRPRITPLSLFITLSTKLMADPRQMIFIL